MRTTVVIDDELFVTVKKLAADRGSSVSAVVVEALRGFVNSRPGPDMGIRFSMPTFDGGGPSVDTTSGEFYRLEEDSELAPFQ